LNYQFPKCGKKSLRFGIHQENRFGMKLIPKKGKAEMTTLNMDLETAQQVIDLMTTAYTDFQDHQKQWRTLLITDLYEAQDWLGKSAKNFYDNYRDVDHQVFLQLEEYGKAINGLVEERKSWEKMGEHLYPDPTHLFPPGYKQP
jgi:hypothetical protein